MPAPVPDVIHLTPFPVPGSARPPAGVPAFASRLIPAYGAAGIRRQLVLADRTSNAPVDPEHPAPGVAVVRAYAPGARFGRVVGRLAGWPRVIVHAQHEVFLYGGPAASVQFSHVIRAARRRGHATLVTVHGVVDLETVDRGFVAANGSRVPPAAARGMLRRLIRAAATAGDAAIVHDGHLAERLVEQYRVAAERVHVIPLPAPDPLPVDRAAARARLGFSAPTAFFFGFVAGYKGLPLLLDAWSVYRSRGGAGELVVAGGRHPRLAGDAAYEREYSAAEARAAAIGGVRWHGYLDEGAVPDYMAACDALVLPYRDGLSASGPMSFALAYGLPVLASDVLQASAPHPAGVFPRDPDALADLLRAALETPLGAELGAASARAGAERSLAGVAGATVELYRRLAA